MAHFSRTISFVLFTFLVLIALPCISAEDENEDYEKELFYPALCKASVKTTPIYAGSSVESVIACANIQEDFDVRTAILVMGYLQPKHMSSQILQNFSIVRQAKSIQQGSAVSFLYTFVPSSELEPDDYNLVLGVYFRMENAQKTALAVAYNSTISIQASDSDPQLIMTYIILLGLICAVIYGIASKLGLLKSKVSKPSPSTSSVTSPTEKSYDVDYISKEHQRFCEEVLNKSTSRHGSPNRKK